MRSINNSRKNLTFNESVRESSNIFFDCGHNHAKVSQSLTLVTCHLGRILLARALAALGLHGFLGCLLIRIRFEWDLLRP